MENNLKLDVEPSCEEIISVITNPKKYNSIVFCGYGDCLTNIDAVKEISKWIKYNGGKVRINTAGLANRYYNKNILLELNGIVDAISISLNGSNSKEYNKINKPMFGEESFDDVIKFVYEAKKYIPITIITSVESLGFDISKVEKIAKKIGVSFKARQYI
jgi:TatD DNase family protein